MKRISIILPIVILSLFVLIMYSQQIKAATITTEPPITDAPTPTQTQCQINGDVNCDGLTDMIDYLYYVRFVAGVRTFPTGVNIDVNNNGTIDDTDRCIILKAITGNANVCSANN